MKTPRDNKTPRKLTEQSCSAVLTKGTDLGTCGLHGCALVRQVVEYEGKKHECYFCPKDKNKPKLIL